MMRKRTIGLVVVTLVLVIAVLSGGLGQTLDAPRLCRFCDRLNTGLGRHRDEVRANSSTNRLHLRASVASGNVSLLCRPIRHSEVR
jgi:hypothetical protein